MDRTAPAAASLTLSDRLLGHRPTGTARTLARVTGVAMLAACAAAAVLSTVFPGTELPKPISIAIGLLFLGVLGLSAATAIVQLAAWFVPRLHGALTVDDRALRLTRFTGTRVVPLDRIAAGWVVHAGDLHEVEFELRNGDVLTTTVNSPIEADALLDAAGVDPGARALSMHLGSALRNVAMAVLSFAPAGCLGSLAALAVGSVAQLPSAALGFLIFLFTSALVGLGVAVTAPPRVRVGLDGVSVKGVRRDEFVPFASITAALPAASAILLQRRDGPPVVIDTAGTPKPRASALFARIQQGVFDAQRPRDLSARLAGLDRNGRSAEQWRTDLAALVADRDGYRSTGLTRDELLAALDDPHTSPERRVAAAWALAHLDGPTAVTRVRVAVETAAEDPVRDALARASEGTLDEHTVAALDAARR